MNDDDLDVHLTLHNGNYVLVMTPFVAQCVRDMCGLVSGNPDSSKIRRATDLVWVEFTEPRDDDTPALMDWDAHKGLWFNGELEPRYVSEKTKASS